MSNRVDNEIEQAERIRQEAARLQRSRDNDNQAKKAQNFSQLVKSIGESKHKEATKEKSRQDDGARGQAKLAVRRGIANRDQTRQVAANADARGQRGRRDLVRATRDKDTERSALADETLAKSLQKTRDEPVSRGRGERQHDSSEGAGAGTGHGDSKAPGADNQRPDTVVAQSGQMATQQAIVGVAPKEAGASSAGLHTDIQQIINELVDAVYKGVDKNSFGFMHIELKSHVLSGSSLSLQSTREGIHLKIQTDDDEVARLLSSGGTANELGRALDGRGIKLASFEVNQQRVLS